MKGVKANVTKEAIKKYGARSQLLMLVEECNELAVAVLHFLRGRGSSSVNEEIADVEIMLEQVKMILGKEESEKIKREKMLRLKERIIREEGGKS